MLSFHELISGFVAQTRYNEVVADPAYLDAVLANGAAKANETARFTLRNAYDAMGFLLPATVS